MNIAICIKKIKNQKVTLHPKTRVLLNMVMSLLIVKLFTTEISISQFFNTRTLLWVILTLYSYSYTSTMVIIFKKVFVLL